MLLSVGFYNGDVQTHSLREGMTVQVKAKTWNIPDGEMVKITFTKQLLEGAEHLSQEEIEEVIDEVEIPVSANQAVMDYEVPVLDWRVVF